METTDNNELCTIIVPTKNRSSWIDRMLKFYDFNNLEHKIIIADSSNKEQSLILNKLILKFQNLNIKIYLCENLNAEQACYKVSSFIDTKYCCFLADDDIINPNFFSKGIDFLKKNTDYNGVTGNSFSFNTQNNLIFSQISDIGIYPVIEEENDNYLLRLRSYFKNNFASIFTLTKTIHFAETFEIISKLQPYHQRYMIGEQLCAINYLYHGKIKKINETFLIRQHHDNNIYGFKNFYKWLIIENFNKSHEILKETLLSNLKLKTKKNNIETEVNNLLDSFYKKCLNSMIKKNSFNFNYFINFKRILKLLLIKTGLIKRFRCQNLKLYIQFIEKNHLRY